MDLQTWLDQHHISKYHLAKISGVPKTTIMDICAGRSDIERCAAGTVRQLAKALGLAMEDMLDMFSRYDAETGLPKDRSYFEHNLPPFLTISINAMKDAWEKLDRGEEYTLWDCDYCDLQSSINIAEVEQIISPDQAWYLREKYLGLERVSQMELGLFIR